MILHNTVCTTCMHTHTHQLTHSHTQITELVHQRDTTRMLISNRVAHTRRFEWLSQMRFYFDPKKSDVLQQLSIHMANAQFNYGFEYLGVQDRLVQTPLTDRCYLTMTQALEERLGGSPFGMTYCTRQIHCTWLMKCTYAHYNCSSMYCVSFCFETQFMVCTCVIFAL